MKDFVFEEPLTLTLILSHLSDVDIVNFLLAFKGGVRFGRVTDEVLYERHVDKLDKFKNKTKLLLEEFENHPTEQITRMNDVYDHLVEKKWFVRHPVFEGFVSSVLKKLNEQIGISIYSLQALYYKSILFPGQHKMDTYVADFLDLFGRVIEDDGKLYCTTRCVVQFVQKHGALVELVTGTRPVTVETEDGDIIPDKDRVEEFKQVFSAALVCYEKIILLTQLKHDTY